MIGVSDEVLTIDEAAEVLKVETEVVLGLLESKELPGRLIGGEWRTTSRALVSFVDGVPIQTICCTPDGCCTPVVQSSGNVLLPEGGNCCGPDGCC